MAVTPCHDRCRACPAGDAGRAGDPGDRAARCAHAVPLARALVAGGVRMLEVTLRTPVALACIEAIARDVPEAVVGAGTVRSAADAQAAALAGARFAVSPGYTPRWARPAATIGLPLLPGVATGSEIMAAQEDGYTELKFFPALQAGGSAMLKAWAGPFGDVVSAPPAASAPPTRPSSWPCPTWPVVGGSWLVPADAAGARATGPASPAWRASACSKLRGDDPCGKALHYEKKAAHFGHYITIWGRDLNHADISRQLGASGMYTDLVTNWLKDALKP
jgi:2-dehydro-3-deoxyphosphogluconate aldolase/(4S)-4-hydroxy-2-oxoglutarate aldolase